MHITKKHKLYYIDENGAWRNLNKNCRETYSYVLLQFLKKGAMEKYEEFNKHTKVGQRLHLPMQLPWGFKPYIDKLTKKDVLHLYYNGTYVPLVALTVAPLEQKCPDCGTKLTKTIPMGQVQCRKCLQYVEVEHYVVKRAIPKELVVKK